MRYTESMLYIRSLTATEQRTLRQLQGRATATLAQRARMVFLSSDGWSVPALAELIGCCRRTVRKWLHAFVEHGLAGLVGKAVGRPAQVVSSSPLSATSLPSPAPSRLVSVIASTRARNSTPAQPRGVAPTTRSRARLALVTLSALQTGISQTEPLSKTRCNPSSFSTTTVVVLISLG